MKLILIISALLIIPESLICQNKEIILNSSRTENTGSVRHLEGEFNKQNGELKVGKGSFYSFFRGFVVFDHTNFQKQNILIQNIELILSVKRFDQFSIDTLQISFLNQDPRRLDSENLYNTISEGIPIYTYPLKISSTGEYKIQLNSNAKKLLNSKLNQSYWAFGFHFLNDSIDILRNLLIFEGSNLVNSAPALKIKYDIESIQSSINGRPINYSKELKFINKNINIYVWDHLQVDGDVISLYLNGKPLIANYHLKKEKKSISFTLDPSQPNDLFLYAHNEGQSPPNTVSIEITDGVIKENIILNSSLTSCEGIIIYLK